MADATITVNIKDGVTPHLEKLIETLGSKKLTQTITQSIHDRIQSHLILVNGQRANALGGKRTNFFAKAADSMALIIGADKGQVVIRYRGFRYQLKGGTIHPSGCLSAITGKPIRHLAIPIHAEAHGKRPSDLGGNLFVLRSKEKNQAYLARPKGRGKNKELIFLYVLKTSVSKKPDPSVLPTQADISAAVHKGLQHLFRRSK